MKIRNIGRWILSFFAVFTAVSPYAADWNETHIYNPNWPPHAKFHNAQTMLMGALLGIFSLLFLWSKKGDQEGNLQIGRYTTGRPLLGISRAKYSLSRNSSSRS